MKYLFPLAFIILIIGCKDQNPKPMKNKYSNALVNETSPYLLQHAHNPVNWNPWNETTLKKAKTENKLLLISVGYAACHWCHVMEHESFEDSLVAQVMNKNFINIKVDREERPDVDQVYMSAVQLMTGSGGWPLNVIALPDGRPVWGGTYFKKEQWTDALDQISKLYTDNPEKLQDYANKLEEGIKSLDVIKLNTDEPIFDKPFIEDAVTTWSKQFDNTQGGLDRAPKFMMPNNYHFLLRYAYQNNDEKLLEFVNLTLKQMAFGGVFDQVGGGFSRYSVDAKWHVPHFEKMLYDNAQLVSLYSDAYLITKNELYKDVITETLKYINRDMTTNNGAFFSSLDADSNTPEGELKEGAFYVWTKDELKTIIKEDFEVFSDYYNVNNYGFWEHDNYVLIRKDDDATIIKKHNLSPENLIKKKNEWKSILIKERNKRAKPRLDDKSLTSWNSLMISGYLDAYSVFNKKEYLNIALKNAHFISKNLLSKNGKLYHNYKKGKITINGFLEDYAATSEAFIKLHEITSDEISEQEYFDHGTLLVAFVRSGVELAFEAMTDSGIIDASAYYESLHETPLIANTIARMKLAEMNRVISDTAEYGCYLFDHACKPLLTDFMKTVSTNVIGKKFTDSNDVDNQELIRINSIIRTHPVEKVGAKLRASMTAMKVIKSA